jgi:tetratricopeptide (TPR) repeat protein
VPELSLQSVNCRDEKDPRVRGRLEAILQAADKAKLTPLPVAEAAIHNLAVSQPGQSYLLAQLYQGHAQWGAALETLARLAAEQDLASSYLQQQLGTLAVEAGDYAQAEKYYQAALTMAQARANLESQAAAYLGLVVTAFYQGETGQAQQRYQALARLSPESKWVDLVKILLQSEAGIAPTPADPLTGQGASEQAEQRVIGYVRALSEALILETAPQLIDNYRQIADIFLSRLAAMPKPLSLRPNFVATLGSGSGAVFETMELLAATYLTTQSLLDLDLGDPLGLDPSPEIVRTQAEHVARTAVGLQPPQAQVFAEQYAALVARQPDAFRALLKR